MFTLKPIVGALICSFVLAMPAAADSKVERRLNLQPGGTFTLDTAVGSVVVTGDAASGATVTVTSRRDDLQQRYEFDFQERAGAVDVIVKRRGSRLRAFLFSDWWEGGVQFVINVPRKTTLNVRTSGGTVDVSRLEGSARLSSSGGGLRIEDVQGEVQADTSGGRIEARRIAGNLLADTSGGGIRIADVKGRVRAETSGGGIDIDNASGDVLADTSGGGIEIRGVGGHVEAHTSGGPVTVTFAAGNGRGGDLSTSGGGVRVELDPKVALSIEASSSGGRVTSDLPVTTRGRLSDHSFRGDLNGGGPILRLRSSGGGVRIASTSRTTESR